MLCAATFWPHLSDFSFFNTKGLLIPILVLGSMTKWVYTFGNGAAEGRGARIRDAGRQGGQSSPRCAASACPFPPGSTITADACSGLIIAMAVA